MGRGPVDIEGEVVGVLNAVLTPPVATKVPNPRPASGCVRVTSTGGARRNVVQSAPRVLVECWGPDSVTAFGIARDASVALLDSYGDAEVWGGRASLTEPVNLPDPETTSPRYQFVATILTNLEGS